MVNEFVISYKFQSNSFTFIPSSGHLKQKFHFLTSEFYSVCDTTITRPYRVRCLATFDVNQVALNCCINIF